MRVGNVGLGVFVVGISAGVSGGRGVMGNVAFKRHFGNECRRWLKEFRRACKRRASSYGWRVLMERGCWIEGAQVGRKGKLENSTRAAHWQDTGKNVLFVNERQRRVNRKRIHHL